MNLAKAVFVVFLIIYNAVGFVHGVLYAIVMDSMTIAWMASMVSNATLSCFFLIYLGMLKPARTSRHLPGMLVVTTSSAIVILADVSINQFQMGPVIYGVFSGCIGAYLFVFWYSHLDRRYNAMLQVGNKLPALELERYNGKRLNLANCSGRPVLYLFYPGSWCPLSLSQISEIAVQVDEFAERGVVLLLISPQPREEAQQLAVSHPTRMNFVVDYNCSIARRLGICHERGLPMGLELLGYDSDTVYPTLVMTDGNGRIIYSDLTNNYRMRPALKQLFDALDEKDIKKQTAGFTPLILSE